MIKDPSKFPPQYHVKKPFRHQEDVWVKSRDLKQYGILWEMGCGKTKTLLDTACYLFLKQEIDGLLVVCDNGAYRNWVDYEIPMHWMPEITCRVAFWCSQIKRDDLRKAEQLLVARDDVMDILVMNVEGFSYSKAPVFAEAFIQSHYAMICVDESTSIKNGKSDRAQELKRLGRMCEYRRIMSGTPLTNGPLDAFAQFDFLGDSLLGFDSFVAFRANFANTILIDMGRGRRYHQVVSYRNIDDLSRRVAEHSSRVLKSECLDLPEKIYETVHVEHTPEQSKIYTSLRETALAELSSGMITVTSALTALSALHRVNCGHVKNDDGTLLDIPSNRINELLRIIETIGDKKIIIWAHFQRDIELIREKLIELFGVKSVVDYYGGTSAANRPISIHRFRTDPTCRYFLGNPATAGKGITLVESHDVVYYSQDYNLGFRLQSEDRNHRPGQTHAVTYTDMVVPGTVDVKIVRALRNKKDLASQILDSFRDLLA